WKPFKSGDEMISQSELRPVLRGIFIALIGASATSLLILGLSQMWFGRYGAGGLSLAASIILFFIFHKLTKAFLNFLTIRITEKNDESTVISPTNLESKIP